MKNIVYISGPITGKKGYFGTFERAETLLTDAGFIALNPARLPEGMTNEQYMRINFAMLDSADAVLFLDGWENGRHGPTLAAAVAVADALHISLDEYVGHKIKE